MPVISIIMPVYNAEAHIAKTILSIINQSFTDWELIIVDDYSNDQTLKVVKKIQSKCSKIRLIELSFNSGGPATPRNIGIKHANGEWTAFIDSDDLWVPDKLSIQLSIVKKTGTKFVASEKFDFYEAINLSYKKHLLYKRHNLTEINFKRLLKKNIIPASSVLLSRDIAQKYYFNNDKEFIAIEDYDYWLQILYSGYTCQLTSQKLVFYKKYKGQLSGSKIMMARKVFKLHYKWSNNKISQTIMYYLYYIILSLKNIFKLS